MQKYSTDRNRGLSPIILVMPDGQPGDDFLCRIANALHDEFDIDHTTIQVETGEHPCVLSGHAAH